MIDPLDDRDPFNNLERQGSRLFITIVINTESNIDVPWSWADGDSRTTVLTVIYFVGEDIDTLFRVVRLILELCVLVDEVLNRFFSVLKFCWSFLSFSLLDTRGLWFSTLFTRTGRVPSCFP